MLFRSSKLVGVFKPDFLGHLVTRARRRSRAEVLLAFEGVGEPVAFDFASNARSEVQVKAFPRAGLDETPVFLPAHELLTVVGAAPIGAAPFVPIGAASLVPYRSDTGSWGYKNRGGIVIIPPFLDAARPFSEGVAAVSFRGRWWYIVEPEPGNLP